MADMKIPPGGGGQLPATRPQNAARSEAIRAAQKAFFDAAMNQAPAPAVAPARAPSRPAAVQAAAPVQTAAPAATTEPPQRYLRPGSRLDIKV